MVAAGSKYNVGSAFNNLSSGGYSSKCKDLVAYVSYRVLCVRAHPPVCMCAVFVSKETHSLVAHNDPFLPLQHADKRVLKSVHDLLGR